MSRFNYPSSKKTEDYDDFFGVEVKDPWRWLENPDSDETKTWIKAQNALTFAYLEQLEIRKKLQKRITELWNYEKFTVPFKRGNRYFYSKNDGLQNQDVLYTLDSLDGVAEVLLEPNQLSLDGTVALSGLAISDDGKLMAYGLATAGSDWIEYRVKNVETKEVLEDHLKWIKFSGVSWAKDNQGFFYSCYDEPNAETKFEELNYYQKLYYHRLGTSQGDDILIYHRPDQKEWRFSPYVTEDGCYLIIRVGRGTEPKNLVFYKDLQNPDSEVIELIDEFEASYDFIEHNSSIFWFRTDLDAPKGKVIGIELNHLDPSHWQEIIAEAQETLEKVGIINNQFVANYLQDAKSQVKILALDGTLIREIELPGMGTVRGFNGKSSDTETFYSFTSFTTPTTSYRYDMRTGKSTIFRQPQIDFNSNDYVTKQVFYPSKDGTIIPMFITHKKDLQLDGNNPTYLYGYGGFNFSLTPSFSIGNLVWLELGGVYVVPNLRGGSEYGEAWHQAGIKEKKQNVFDDFIAAAEWLITHQYTSSGQLAISGRSNGGLLVAACMSQRPELFAVVLPAVGVLDMLRFPKFTIGWAWCSEYGSPDQEEDFKILYSYSPLHNLQPGTKYPATLITTAEYDDRVVPAHSFKFAAALQAAHGGDNPILIRIETKAGHGAGKPTKKIIEEIADKWAFVLNNLN